MPATRIKSDIIRTYMLHGVKYGHTSSDLHKSRYPVNDDKCMHENYFGYFLECYNLKALSKYKVIINKSENTML